MKRLLRWFLARFAGMRLGSMDDEERIKDRMLVILTKEDTGEQQRVD